ncbi:hypothetical protein Ae505Ps2_0614 [Pseudonocardia sp. Ae505_Ps2]|nr:hypothetical protein Ae505Ps2_0614 [Pseudonocardia sp. Ae505_Ps2]
MSPGLGLYVGTDLPRRRSRLVGRPHGFRPTL